MAGLPESRERSTHIGAAALLLASLCFPAHASEDAAAHANRVAYDAAMKCFIADGILTADKRRQGNKAGEAAFEAKARQSFEVAVQLGQKLGYSGTRVNEDFGLAQTRETARLMSDTAYFHQTANMCKVLGLM